VTTTIAIAGKGGTGKTTIAAFLIELLADRGSVLAIDADPSSNLHLVLGLPLEETVGSVREEMLTAVSGGSFGVGLSKQDWFEIRISEALVESDRVDLLAMGRPEGPGCYCAANNILRVCIDRLAGSYDYVVIDNEAGMEHISRRTTRDVDILIAVSDPTVRGVAAVGRIVELVGELKTKVGRMGLVINRLSGQLPAAVEEAVRKLEVELLGVVPEDKGILECDATGKPLVSLPPESPARQAVEAIAKKLGLV